MNAGYVLNPVLNIPSFDEPPQFIDLREFRYSNARYVLNLVLNIPSFDEPPQFIEGVINFGRKWVIRQQNWGISLFKKQGMYSTQSRAIMALDPVRTHINYQRGSCYNDGNF